jgi:hypothetical protein
MDAELRARHREQPRSAEGRVRLERTPGQRAPGAGPQPADRRRPGFTPVPDSRHTGGVTVVVTRP